MPDSTPRRFDLSGLGLLDDAPPAEIVCGDLVLKVRPFELLTPIEHGAVQRAGADLDRLAALGSLDEQKAVELMQAADGLLELMLLNPGAVPPLGLMQRVALVRVVMSVAQETAAAGAAAKKKWAEENLSGSSTPASSRPAATPGRRSRTGSKGSRSPS